MNEKTIIQSEKADIRKIRKVFFLIGIVGFIVFLILSAGDWTHYLSPEYIDKYGFDDLFVLLALGLLVFSCPFFLIGQLFYLCMSKIELTVTDKRVFGRTAFGKRVDLPLDSISAIGMGSLNSIAITTSSGAIKFSMVKNKDEIHKTVSELLIVRQSKAPSVEQERATNNSDYTEELKKIKDLLDAGVITQEEFDAKKKQILGL